MHAHHSNTIISALTWPGKKWMLDQFSDDSLTFVLWRGFQQQYFLFGLIVAAKQPTEQQFYALHLN